MKEIKTIKIWMFQYFNIVHLCLLYSFGDVWHTYFLIDQNVRLINNTDSYSEFQINSKLIGLGIMFLIHINIKSFNYSLPIDNITITKI